MPLPRVAVAVRFLMLCALVLGGACADTSTAANLTPVVRDSAGIEIVEHSAELIAGLPEWGVVGEPVVELGGGDHPAEEFTSIRGAVRLPDGRILITEGGSSELRLFDSLGAYLTTWARRGQGPGEFTSIGLPHLGPGDEVLVADANARRTAVFDTAGRFIRQIIHPRSSEEGVYLGVAGHLPDGRVLLQSNRFGNAPGALGGPVRRDTFAMVMAPESGAPLDTVALLPGPELYDVQFQEGEFEGIGQKSPAFGRSTYMAVSAASGWLLIGTNEGNEVRVYVDGAIRQILRDLTAAEPVLPEHRDRYVQEELARLERGSVPEALKAQWLANAERDRRYAEAFPFYERLLFGTDGSIWVEGNRRFEDQGRRYVVYDRTGRALARATFPDRVRPLQVGPTEMIGMWRDPDDVVHLRVWRVGPVVR